MPTSDSDVVTVLSDLVRIESVTPWLISTGSGERKVAEHIAGWLDRLDCGIEISLPQVTGNRPNLLARLPGTTPGPTLCINAHSDTVGYAAWADRALTPRRDGDRLYGLGVADDKSGCAAGMLALRALAAHRDHLAGDVLLACVIDEEGVSAGTEHLVEDHEIDYALVIEPEGLPHAITQHQGFGWIDITVHGKPAHGSRPEEGIDAIVHMARVIDGLHHLDQHSFAAHPDPRNGRTVFHTGTITGGTDYATYPSQVTLGIEIGTQPGETLTERINDMHAIFDSIHADYPDFRADVHVRLDRDPFRAVDHEPLLDALHTAAGLVLATQMVPTGLNAWTDAALMQAAGIPTVLLGPRGDNFHAPDEWVSISEVAQLTDLITATALSLLR